MAAHGKKIVRRRWDDLEAEFVVKNYGPMTSKQLGEALGRTAWAIRSWVKRNL
jgi:hypothetical protein